MTLEGSLDTSFLKVPAVFWKVQSSDRIVAVLSGFATGSDTFRIRGLWVDETERRCGLATALVEHARKHAIEAKFKTMWTAPRQRAWQFYSKMGFQQITAFGSDGYEFGPNCLAVLSL